MSKYWRSAIIGVLLGANITAWLRADRLSHDLAVAKQDQRYTDNELNSLRDLIAEMRRQFTAAPSTPPQLPLRIVVAPTGRCSVEPLPGPGWEEKR